jgi:hypothetical protein
MSALSTRNGKDVRNGKDAPYWDVVKGAPFVYLTFSNAPSTFYICQKLPPHSEGEVKFCIEIVAGISRNTLFPIPMRNEWAFLYIKRDDRG